mmetsp:Transcript_4686/g.5255  ORF Transcript_4686/g.5255 Transcript_4686/m.5255 type:complete len:83 (+) Transcript_4686:179-427(+)
MAAAAWIGGITLMSTIAAFRFFSYKIFGKKISRSKDQELTNVIPLITNRTAFTFCLAMKYIGTANNKINSMQTSARKICFDS